MPAQAPAAWAPDPSAGECCARAQAESWARAEVRRFAPRPVGYLTRLRAQLARLGGRAGKVSGA